MAVSVVPGDRGAGRHGGHGRSTAHGRSTGRSRAGWRGLAALLAAAGALHLVVPAVYAPVVPRRLGDPRPWVLWSGVAELACAAGLARATTRRGAGWASAALFVLVYPANLAMAVRAVRSPHASGRRRAVTLARLPLQVPLVWWALRVARDPRSTTRPAARTTPRPAAVEAR